MKQILEKIGAWLKKAKIKFTDLYRGPLYKRTIVWIVTCVVAFILLLIAVDINFLYLFGKSPGFKEIENPVTSEASEIYSADNILIGRFFNENRTPVKYKDISPIVIHTLIDTEDERFYHHHGIDFQGLFAAAKDIAGGHARGASTITQQLAKNLFRVRTQYSAGLLGKIPGVKILIMKAKEWIVAIKLEMLFSKEEILTMYLNTVDFGSNSFGIKTACRTYFNTTPDKLTYEQAATLVGLLKATSSYNPKLNPRNSTKRRNVVLTNLYTHGHLMINGRRASTAQLDSLKALPMIVSPRREESSYDGIAPYFREVLPAYIDMLCKKGLIAGADSENPLDLYADGLKIYTTLDTRMQKYAEEAAVQQMKVLQQRFNQHWGKTNPWQNEQHEEIPNFIEDLAKKTPDYKYLEARFPNQPDSIAYYQNRPHKVKLFSYDGMKEEEMSTMDSIRYMVKFMHCGFVAMEPDTRQVKAWVGDIDFGSWKYDKVTAMRQPGSTFKLFVYTEAMNQGLTPCDTRVDEWQQYPDTVNGEPTMWTPHNANGRFSGASIPLKSAFAQSINSIAVKLGYELGIHNVAQTAHAMGIESPLHETPSLSLGSSDVNLLELVNGYCTAIDDGKYNMPIMITKILDRDGNVIYAAELEEKQVIPYRSAFFMQQLLRGGLTERGGTTAALWSYIHPILNYSEFGGKTGTSNNHSDAWFVGVTPKLVAGGWVGGEYRSIHFRTGALGQGSRTALPIFGNFIQKVLLDDHFTRYRVKFPKKPNEDIDPSCYTCNGYYQEAEPDTVAEESDSLGVVLPGDIDIPEDTPPDEEVKTNEPGETSNEARKHPQPETNGTPPSSREEIERPH
ncbi:MAG: transglycosylase domain-containing protein [Paraprevotella sp.]|nr:transglycosylase domain-containing protein [Paraprevotella sp.]